MAAMSKEQITAEAMELPLAERVSLARALWKSAEATGEPPSSTVVKEDSLTILDHAKALASRVEFLRVPGSPNSYAMQPKFPTSEESDAGMTEADWDKFEADINEAFEKIP